MSAVALSNWAILSDVCSAIGCSRETAQHILGYLHPFVSVSTIQHLSREGVIQLIGKIQKPHVLIWYIGEHGFKQECVNYYKKDLRKLSALNNQTQVILYDLTGWIPFRNREGPDKGSLTDYNPNIPKIISFAIPHLSAIASSELFAWMAQEKDPLLTHYVSHHLLQNPQIFKKSEKYKPCGATILTVFQQALPMLQSIAERDCAQCYSAIQYLEGCYLVIRLVEKYLSNQPSELNIVFMGPNDEAEYYNYPSFAVDISNMLLIKFPVALKIHKLNIYFYMFKFGLQPINRPYNAGVKTVATITRADLGF